VRTICADNGSQKCRPFASLNHSKTGPLDAARRLPARRNVLHERSARQQTRPVNQALDLAQATTAFTAQSARSRRACSAPTIGCASTSRPWLRADPESVAKTLLVYRQGGILTPNEARASIGYAAHPEDDTLAPPAQGIVA
jgi:hypothetical protein